MSERTLNTDQTPDGGTVQAKELPAFVALVIDVAGVAETHESQDAVTDFIWHMLERGYQIYGCSSTPNDGDDDARDEEEFAGTGLTWLGGGMPPSAAQVQQVPALQSPRTLWISDDPRIWSWAAGAGVSYVSLGDKSASFDPNLGIASWGELGSLLDPTTRTVKQVVDLVAELRRSRPPGPILVGLGGPPESGYERFAVELKRILEASEFPLVELMDVSPLFPGGATDPAAALPLAKDSGAQWLVDTVLAPIGTGKSVYVEVPPAVIPAEMRSIFPLFVSEESVVLVLGETALHRGFRDHLHLAILLEVAPRETARRMFEIPEGEVFDESFTEQFLQNDGLAYANFAAANQVVERADLKIDANSPRRFILEPIPAVRN